MKQPIISFFVFLFVFPLFAEEDSRLLTLHQARFANEWMAKSFSQRWTDNDSYLTLEPSKDACGGSDIVRVFPTADQKKGDKKEILIRASQLVPPGQDKAIEISDYSFSNSNIFLLIFTNTKKVWRHNTKGDYWVLNRDTGQLRQLGEGRPESSLMFAKFSPDEKYVAYVSENNIYVETITEATPKIIPLTGTGSQRFINGTFDWVYEEEFDLRDGFRWSPDSKKIAFWQLDTSEVPVHTLIDNTSEFYPTLVQFPYPRVGTTNSAARIGVVELERPRQEIWVPIPGDLRDNYLVDLEWIDSRLRGNDGRDGTLFIRQLNRPQNEMRFYFVPEKEQFQKPQIFRTETDDAWIDLEPVHWLGDGKRFLLSSEKSGWRQLYLFDTVAFDILSFGETDLFQGLPVTPRNMDVIEFLAFDFDEQGEENGVYFYASPENATQKYLYRSDFNVDSPAVRITPENQPGTHNYTISPDGKLAYHTYSVFGEPPVYELVRLPSHETFKMYENHSELREKLERLNLGKREFFSVTINDGQENVAIDALCIYPIDFDPAKKYPVLVHVYGEPAGQTVLDRWGGAAYLWSQMLAQKGYFLVSFDNRGTPAPKGRNWRKTIYKRIGTLGPADQAAALRKTLQERPYLDANRVGIWGWSGGGSMSLHAIFQYPEIYKTAVAIAPVPDERYYDTIYQERYMGLLEKDDKTYRDSSPITYAKNLKGKLLIVHGTSDDNTHYQTTELLFNELIRYNKQFSMMVYPGRAHGIREGEGTTLHLWTLVTGYLLENL